jgi:hypothetical protein
MDTPQPDNQPEPDEQPESNKNPESDKQPEPDNQPESESPPEKIVVPPEDISIRPVEEKDIPHIINLLRLNYGEDYPDQELYDQKYYKRAIYNDNVYWLLAENTRNEEVLASGAVKMDYGDYDDLLGIIGRLVAHPARAIQGLASLGNKIVRSLVERAGESVECIISDARTEVKTSQVMLDYARLKAVGFLPHYKSFKRGEVEESLVVYSNLYGEGPMMRSEKLPQLIEEVEPLARHVLSKMDSTLKIDLLQALVIVKTCPPYSDEFACTFTNGDRHSLAKLRKLDRSLSGDPVVFANVTSNYGMAVLADKEVFHIMAAHEGELAGAIGYRYDKKNKIFQITELVFNRAAVINPLCAEAMRIAAAEGARLIEVDLSAYDARIQQTFLNYGFRPVAYIPAMVFHNGSRLDVVKMIKLNSPYNSSGEVLTRAAQEVVSLVKAGLDSH